MVTVFLGILLMSTVSLATTYTITDPTPVDPFPGGPFLINDTQLTFCLELNEGLTFGIPYLGTIDDAAIAGGVGGPSPDPLSGESKWLYGQFLSDPGSYDGIAMQLAFWVLEEELNQSTWSSSNGYNFSGLNVAILSDATAYINAAQGQNGDPTVKVLNLYDQQGVPKQSLLTRVPEPGSLIFLGSGLIGLAFAFRRKRN